MRPRRDGDGANPRFLALLEEEGLDGRCVLDVGCGGGRLSLWLAQRAGFVVGVDRDAEALAYARRQAEAAGMSNVVFVEMDADRAEYVPFEPEMIVAHLFVSDAMMARAGRALRRGQCLALVAIDVDQWRETGRASRFAYDEGRMVETLRREGFLPEVAEVERRERRFASYYKHYFYILHSRSRRGPCIERFKVQSSKLTLGMGGNLHRIESLCYRAFLILREQ